MMAPTGLDRAVANLFPAWGAKRLRARREFAYEAARSTRLRKSATQLQGPEDYTAFPDRMQLIREMRDLEQNFGLFQSIIDKVSLYAFGTLKYRAHTGDEATDELYEDYFDSCAASCDLSGRHNFRQMVCIADKSEIRDGDFAFKWQRTADQLKMVGVESDRIGGNVQGSVEPNYFQGITVDPSTGAPLTYRVYTRTKANVYMNPVEVGATDMLFLSDPRRYDQYRGITPFAPVIAEARDLKEVLAACLIGTKFENMHAAVGYTESGLALEDPSNIITATETGANGNPLKEQALKYGLIQWAPTGSKIDFMKSERPSANFQTYVDMLVRLIGTALNLPYGFIYQLLGSGPAVRAELQQAQRVIQGRQVKMTERVLNPAKNTWLMEGIARGDIPYAEKWFVGGWQFPPWVTIDAGRDSRAMVEERAAGVRSKSSIFEENGQDSDEEGEIIEAEVVKTLETAQKISKDSGVDLGTVLTMLEIRTPNGYLFRTGPAAQDAQAEDAASVGEKAPMNASTGSQMSAKGRLRGASEHELAREKKLAELQKRYSAN